MNEDDTFTTKRGRVFTDTDLDALADEAEHGYDVAKMTRRPGRPRMGSAPATAVPVRLHKELFGAVKALALVERTSLSELVRDALGEYLQSEPTTPEEDDGRGRPSTIVNADDLAKQAEAGYDVSALKERPVRRRRGRTQVVPVRMSPELQSAVEARAEAELTSVSEIIRAAIRARLTENDTDPPEGGQSIPSRRGPTEADTCRDFVLPSLKAAGWKDTQIIEQYRITDGRVIAVGSKHRRATPLRADYVLEYRPGLPIAVVEAKRAHSIPGKGLQQARNYALRLDVPFAYATNGRGIVEDDRNTGIERTDLVGFPAPDDLWTRYREWLGIEEDAPAMEGLLLPFNRALRNPDGSVKEPRYYQRAAINRAVNSILKGETRLLLTMATGTGKTFVAMQIIWKLWNVAWRPGRNPRILYLADRNVLIDQPIEREFKPAFGSGEGSPIWKLRGEAKLGREIYFGLYQQLAEGRDRDEMFRQYPPDYFDVIVVDECHRGSARAESSWRAILEYFNEATQVGMTATPKRDETVDTYAYFGGAPIFEYSLAEGIDDGFLAPYRVHRVVLSPDALGWSPDPGQLDLFGKEVPAGLYTTKDFERVVSLLSRTEAAAKHLTNFLRQTDLMAKTIVFCVDQEHADQMRRALHNASGEVAKAHPNYAVRIVSDEGAIGQGHLSDFADTERKYPVIATTSEMLSTGVDMPTVRNIVIFRTIGSMALFKQMIGRGTRLFPDEDKLSFDVIDYSGATALFSDPEFDGPPEMVVREVVDEDGQVVESTGSEPEAEPAVGEAPVDKTPSDSITSPENLNVEPLAKFYVDDTEVWVTAEATYHLDSETHRLRLVEYRDFIAETVRSLFPEPSELRSKWVSRVGRKDVLDALVSHGIDADDMINRTGMRDADPLDVLVHLAWNQPLSSRFERAQRVRRDREEFFEAFKPAAREVLTTLLEKYAEHGITELDDLRVLEVLPLSMMGTPAEIASRFGSADALRSAVARLSELVYAA